MRNCKKNTRLSIEELTAIKNQLQNLYPELNNVRIKNYYNQGKVTVRADFNNRCLFIRAKSDSIFKKISIEYQNITLA